MTSKRSRLIFLAGFSFLFVLPLATARQGRVAQIPNGSVNFCLNCHFNIPEPEKSSARNPFGVQVEARVPPGVLDEFWDPELAGLDADDDGYSNGLELLDPEGVWKQGDPDPGDPILIGNPGVPQSTPLATYTSTETPTSEPTETPTETPTEGPTDTPTETAGNADINGDGIVDKKDLIIFLKQWHQMQQ